ncbi:hypothetical protein [Demequina capsici]|uniref:ABC-2 type transport system permease protein n=1 Tax=Demequina capsici TaxID=3075620 RepID=A0AA96F7H6_9MICO|nr:hypothetical protein [Demequina sp. OYTSA14]WNM25218.1 hypothetical protein RN606_03455 [Demequina sp. OYTSA14]
MVATILSLRWRTTVQSLRRDWWRLLVVIAGAVWSLSLLPSLVWAERALEMQFPSVRTDALVICGAVLMLGWLLVPLLVTGLDDTLDPARFASFGVDARRIVPGLAVAAFLTVPAMFTMVAMVLLAVSWRDDWPALAVALAGAMLTVAMMILSGRVAVMWAARLLTGRRSRMIAAAAGVAGLAMITPAAFALMRQGLETVLDYDVPTLISALSVTPLGAGLAAPELAAQGRWSQAAWHLALVLGWCLLLLGAWRDSVARALVTPPSRSAGVARRDDRVLGAEEAATVRLARHDSRQGRASAPVRGAARLRSGPIVRAVRSRALTYWMSDPRYLAAGIGALVGPVVMFGVLLPAIGTPRWTVFLMPVAAATSIAWGRHNDVAYDSTALWLDVVSGRLGRHVMRGRVEALLAWAVPVVVAASVAAAWVAHRWDLAIGLTAASLGVLGTTLGISAVLSVWMPYRAPQPGANPFGAEVGSVGAGLAAQLLSSVASVVTAPLVLVPFVLAVAVHPAWSVVATGTGLALGTAGVVLGVRFAGDLYDARSGRLLSAVV